MQTEIEEIADGVFRLSTFIPDIPPTGLSFNQFLIRGEEPLLFHTGMRGLFPLVSEAVAKLLPLTALRWISCGHVEADECGAMNEWFAAAPAVQMVAGHQACNLSLNDLCDRAPHPLGDGETLDIGGHRLRWLDTPHVPHGWEAGVMFDEASGVLLCGDLLTQSGATPALASGGILDAAIAAESMFGAMARGPGAGEALRRLAALQPSTLAVMHGASFRGAGDSQLLGLAEWCDARG